MTSLLSCYWGPEHGRREDLDYFRKLQPADILILQPDVQQISDAYQASPESMITLRRWDWDDNRSPGNPGIYPHLRDDPHGYAGWLVDRYKEWVPELEQQAKERGLPFPEREQLVAHHANEPDTNNLLPQINRSNAVGAQLFRERLGMPMDGLNLSTGHPAILNAEGWPDWTPLAEALDALTRYDGYAVTHEYFNDLPIEHESVYPWHVGRHAKWAPRGPRWKIGEFNLEMLLNGRRDDHHGWQGILSEDEMVSRTAWYLGQTRDDVVAVRFYMTDYRDSTWSTFDSLPLHDRLIVVGWQYPSEREIEPATTDHSIHLPNVQSGNPQPTAAPEQPQPGDKWARSLAFVRKWEGGWADNPVDPGGATNKGITFRTFKAWRKAQGQPEPTKNDLRNLSDEEQEQILYEWYWLPSDADQEPWPDCLNVFDIAVNGGVERAEQLIFEVSAVLLPLMARRLEWYTNIDGFEHFGEAWVRRCADLLRVASETELPA